MLWSALLLSVLLAAGLPLSSAGFVDPADDTTAYTTFVANIVVAQNIPPQLVQTAFEGDAFRYSRNSTAEGLLDYQVSNGVSLINFTMFAYLGSEADPAPQFDFAVYLNNKLTYSLDAATLLTLSQSEDVDAEGYVTRQNHNSSASIRPESGSHDGWHAGLISLTPDPTQLSGCAQSVRIVISGDDGRYWALQVGTIGIVDAETLPECSAGVEAPAVEPSGAPLPAVEPPVPVPRPRDPLVPPPPGLAVPPPPPPGPDGETTQGSMAIVGAAVAVAVVAAISAICLWHCRTSLCCCPGKPRHAEPESAPTSDINAPVMENDEDDTARYNMEMQDNPVARVVSFPQHSIDPILRHINVDSRFYVSESIGRTCDLSHSLAGRHSLRTTSLQVTGHTTESLCDKGPRGAAAQAGRRVPCSNVDILNDALDDLLDSNALLLDQYKILSATHRRAGGQALVQFALQAPAGISQPIPRVIKFFLQSKAFEIESSLYARSDLQSHMAAVVHVEHEGVVTPSGYVLPAFIVMERGISLDEWAAKEDPDFPTCFTVFLQIVMRLALLHDEAKVAHRDLKPANILWRTSENKWTLIDFGCAAVLGQGEAEVACSIAYASPEVAEHLEATRRTAEVSPAVDMWSLGIVVYELITRRRVISPDTPIEVALDQLRGRRQLPWESRDETHREDRAKLSFLRPHVLSLLSRDPAQRPSASQLLDSLNHMFKPMPSFGDDGSKRLDRALSLSPRVGIEADLVRKISARYSSSLHDSLRVALNTNLFAISDIDTTAGQEQDGTPHPEVDNTYRG